MAHRCVLKTSVRVPAAGTRFCKIGCRRGVGGLVKCSQFRTDDSVSIALSGGIFCLLGLGLSQRAPDEPKRFITCNMSAY